MTKIQEIENEIAILQTRQSVIKDALISAKADLAEEERRAAAEDQAETEALMLRYLTFLGYEKSEYRTSTSYRTVGRRKLSIATADPARIPHDYNMRDCSAYYVQTTLICGTGAHNVLLLAARAHERV